MTVCRGSMKENSCPWPPVLSEYDTTSVLGHDQIVENDCRAEDLLLAVGGRYRKNAADELIALESPVLDLTLNRYINVLRDRDLSIRKLR